jgi:hypothetical protein
MGPIGLSNFLHYAVKNCHIEHPSLLGPLASDQENETSAVVFVTYGPNWLELLCYKGLPETTL